MPRQDERLGAAEGVCVARGELDAVLLGRAGLDFDDDLPAEGDLEAPFPGGAEGDGSCGGSNGLVIANALAVSMRGGIQGLNSPV